MSGACWSSSPSSSFRFLVIGYWPTHSGDEFLGKAATRGGEITFGKTFASSATYPETL